MVVVSGHFFTESRIIMAKKKSVLKGKVKRFLRARRKSGGRSASGKPKHSKVAKMIKLAKARARKGKGKKMVSKAVKKRR